MYVGAALRWLAYHDRKQVTIDDVYGVYDILIPPKQKESRAFVRSVLVHYAQRWNVRRIREGGMIHGNNKSSQKVTLFILSNATF